MRFFIVASLLLALVASVFALSEVREDSRLRQVRQAEQRSVLPAKVIEKLKAKHGKKTKKPTTGAGSATTVASQQPSAEGERGKRSVFHGKKGKKPKKTTVAPAAAPASA